MTYFFGNLPYITSRCKNCSHSHDLIIKQWTKQDPPAQLYSWVLLNSDTAFVMKKQQFEISPTDSARRKMENVQNSLILKTLLNFFVNVWIYISCLFEQWDFFFLIWLYFLLVVHIGSETEACLMYQGGWEVGISVLCVLKLGIYIFYLHSILQIRGKLEKAYTPY